ncbi:MAG TPA: hydantoinase B/oxoprolinase family protein [Chthonomonadaceae bacterium]|nr:hydantoinase B/oxoprolinase family protein [Chthonomonadaceae bacterium]
MLTRTAFDPIQVEVWRHLLAAVAEEMGASLERTAYSPNIKERLDHSCALFDAQGQLLAQAAHIPVHLGAMPLMMQALLPRVEWRPGVMWLCNDPRVGGTHLPDLTLVAPVHAGRTLLGFVASRAHHADIGGLSPGSLPLSTELFHEGLILSPVRLVERGQIREDVLDLVCANSRTPNERRGDLAAQVAANETGIRRFQDLVERYGLPEFRKRTRENIAYAAEAVRQVLRSLPAGQSMATDYLDDDGAGQTDIPIRVTVTVRSSGTITFDFTGSAPQVRGSLNATEAITRSACYYIVRCLVEEEIPTNEGCFAPVEVIAPEGTLVNARFPAPVAAGNTETSQRIVDTLLRALAPFAPDRIPAASQGTMNNLTIGGYDPIRQRPFAYYETIAGGAGASPQGPGTSAVQIHMTNTRNTPVETLESHYPLRVLEVALADGTGGAGAHPGGNGLRRRLQLLTDARVSLLTERRTHPPFGAHGGGPGAPGANRLHEPGKPERTLPGKWSENCPPGSELTIRTPGGGGWGAPTEKTPPGD